MKRPLTPRELRQLVDAARAARRKAYAPYSRFRVGAALLAADGTVYTGANVENASYGLTICAERVAIGNAVSDGRRRFRAIAVVASGRQVTPCGACRQVLAEFGDLEVLVADARRGAPPATFRLRDLLPAAFNL